MVRVSADAVSSRGRPVAAPRTGDQGPRAVQAAIGTARHTRSALAAAVIPVAAALIVLPGIPEWARLVALGSCGACGWVIGRDSVAPGPDVDRIVASEARLAVERAQLTRVWTVLALDRGDRVARTARPDGGGPAIGEYGPPPQEHRLAGDPPGERDRPGDPLDEPIPIERAIGAS